MRTHVSAKGQVVIPKLVREALALAQGDELDVWLDGERIILERAPRERKDWRRWEGRFAGLPLTEDLLDEHRRELERASLP
jgi:AbrB family looped-hinge helix DNA binding protein